MAGPGELAEGRLPVWGSAEPAVRIWGRVVGPIRVGRPTSASYNADWGGRVPRPTGPSSFRVQLLDRLTVGGPCGRGRGVGAKTRCLTPLADPPGCGPAPGTRLSVRMKAIPAQSGRCYRSCPELPAAESRATSGKCPARGCCLSSSGRGSRRALDDIRVGLSRRKPNEELFELESRYPRAVPRRGRGLAVSESRSGPLLPSHEFQSHGTGQARRRGYTNSRLPWCPGCCR